MSQAVRQHDQHQHRYNATMFGFWLFILSDVMLFGAFFATYMILRGNTNGGEAAHELFSLPYVLLQTVLLLTSSVTCAIAVLAYKHRMLERAKWYLAATFILGASFLALEIAEFVQLVNEGASWRASAFLSSYFGVVGLHGLHIIVGLLWAVVLMIILSLRGYTPHVWRKLSLFGLFWHFLDIVWIGVVAIVYLIGVGVHG